MAGRGRGRGSLARWDQTPAFAPVGSTAVASVPPLKKEMSLPSSKMDGSKSKLSSVRVNCIIDVNHFWAQLGSDSELAHFDTYMFALNHWCDNQLPSTINEMPTVGQVVCVQHAASRMWRRAEVTRLCQRMVDVFFLDYGEAECVPLDMLCSNVPGDITSWPPQALYCTLNGVQPPEGEDQWSEMALKRFDELVNSGQRLAASHDSGSFELILYILDEDGQMKSLGSILAEEGLAKETIPNIEPVGEQTWPEAPQRRYEPDKNASDNSELKNLNKLEQQLVMSGFSYLIAPAGNSEIKPGNEFAYESTTISSSYCSYKKAPQAMPALSSIPNFTPPINEPPGASRNHISSRPHLASPGEFMSSTKLSSIEKEPEENRSAGFGAPGSQRTTTTTTANDYNRHQSAWYYSNPGLVTNTWSPSEQQFPNDWKLSNEDQAKDNSLYGSHDMFYSEKDQPSLASGLEYHLDDPSAFHNPKFRQQDPRAAFSMPFSSSSAGTFETQSSVKSQKQESSMQQPQNTQQQQDNHEKTLKTELSWQKWKFQRNVKRLFDKDLTADDEIHDMGIELGMLIRNSKLSKNFEGVSEVVMVLEMITERVLDKNDFVSLAAKICHILSGLEIAQFTRYLCKVVTAIRDDIVQHLTVSDWEQRCERFSVFIGKMILIATSEECTNNSFKSAVYLLASQCLEKWLKLDQLENKPEHELEGFVTCLKSLLSVISPTMEDQKLSPGSLNLENVFSSIKDHVLSESLPRSIKSSLLDILLLRASGWSEKHEEFTEEVGANRDTQNELPEEDGEVNNQDEVWDPYGKVCAMLEKLKLEDLFKKFKDNRIRDTLLVANKEDFKKTLQEASFPPGVILEIQMFLEKGEEMTARKKSTSISKDSKGASTLTASPSSVGSNKEKGHRIDHEEEPFVDKMAEENRHVVEQEDNTESSWRSQATHHGPVNEQVEKIEPPQPSEEKKPEQRRPPPDNNTEESKTTIIDAHNLFEPSYLSRPPPLRMTEPSAFEYDQEQESPGNQEPMSYSAVLKVKNEELHSETQAKSIPVKLTSLSKVNESVKDSSQTTNKQQLQKHPAKETAKESSGGRRDQTSAPRPPPGLPPLPPKNWGQSPELRLTVLQNARRGKTEDTSTVGPPSGDPPAWKNRQGFSVPQDSRPMAGRGGTAPRGRLENRGGFSRGNNEGFQWQGKPGPLSWRRLEGEPQTGKSEPLVRPFGPGGQKACFTCGSKDHMTCNDRSKMFFD